MAEEEVATATVYLDLLLRSVTHPGLLQTFVKFVLCEKFEKIKIIELLVNRINNRSFKVSIHLFLNLFIKICFFNILNLFLYYNTYCVLRKVNS